MHKKSKSKLRIEEPVLPHIKLKLILKKIYQKEKLLFTAQKMMDYSSNPIWQIYIQRVGDSFYLINLHFSKLGY